MAVVAFVRAVRTRALLIDIQFNSRVFAALHFTIVYKSRPFEAG